MMESGVIKDVAPVCLKLDSGSGYSADKEKRNSFTFFAV